MAGERYVVLDRISGKAWLDPLGPAWPSPHTREQAERAVFRLGPMMPAELEALAAKPDTWWFSGWLVSAARLEVRRRADLDADERLRAQGGKYG